MTIVDYVISDNMTMLKHTATKGDVNRLDGPFQTGVLHWAVIRPNIELIDYWLMLDPINVNVNMQSSNGNTPLHLSIISRDCIPLDRNLEVIGILLRAGADVTLRNQNGETPLSLLRSDGLDSAIKSHIKTVMFDAYHRLVWFLCCFLEARSEREEYMDMENQGYVYERREWSALEGLFNVDDDNILEEIMKFVMM
jgi:hypothetical protein